MPPPSTTWARTVQPFWEMVRLDVPVQFLLATEGLITQNADRHWWRLEGRGGESVRQGVYSMHSIWNALPDWVLVRRSPQQACGPYFYFYFSWKRGVMWGFKVEYSTLVGMAM
jgi:hypothetical protein